MKNSYSKSIKENLDSFTKMQKSDYFFLKMTFVLSTHLVLIIKTKLI